MSENKNVLLVEDDDNLGSLLQEYLNHKNYNVDLKRNGQEGWVAFQAKLYDAILLDVMMPQVDGFTLAKRIRETNKEVPIIFLTAKSLKEDKIKGYTIGADDYITKPFSMDVLELKLNAILRRVVQNDIPVQDTYQAGDSTLDYKNRILKVPSEEFQLTTKENELLRLFFERKNKLLPREIALKDVWKNDSYFTARSMDVFISKLRKYLRSDERLSIINIHGEGYKMVEN